MDSTSLALIATLAGFFAAICTLVAPRSTRFRYIIDAIPLSLVPTFIGLAYVSSSPVQFSSVVQTCVLIQSGVLFFSQYLFQRFDSVTLLFFCFAITSAWLVVSSMASFGLYFASSMIPVVVFGVFCFVLNTAGVFTFTWRYLVPTDVVLPLSTKTVILQFALKFIFTTTGVALTSVSPFIGVFVLFFPSQWFITDFEEISFDLFGIYLSSGFPISMFAYFYLIYSMGIPNSVGASILALITTFIVINIPLEFYLRWRKSKSILRTSLKLSSYNIGLGDDDREEDDIDKEFSNLISSEELQLVDRSAPKTSQFSLAPVNGAIVIGELEDD
jgi:hypothetical protein